MGREANTQAQTHCSHAHARAGRPRPPRRILVERLCSTRHSATLSKGGSGATATTTFAHLRAPRSTFVDVRVHGKETGTHLNRPQGPTDSYNICCRG
eukprot:scaffold455_cov116-Isochrysis_galbana.AAC.2